MGGAEARSRIRGSLLAGGVGDALGAPVEFLPLDAIRGRFGPEGVRDYAPAFGRLGAITDDTQLCLFVAEGLVLAAEAGSLARTGELLRIQHRAHLRWLYTQGERSRHPSFPGALEEGWLLRVSGLFSRRAPGNTCLSGLRSGRMGTLEQPLNESKGCGGVMRAAPVGLARAVADPFDVGCRVAALTHGHPSGWLPAGFLAAMVRDLVHGDPLRAAVEEARFELARRPAHGETLRAVEDALALASQPGRPTPERVESLGGAWVGEESLAIGLYCALVAANLPAGLLLAVNHSGDSDSTGAVAGHLLGAVHGEAAIPAAWRERLELRSEIERAADALAALT